MSAIKKLLQKPNDLYTPLEAAVVFLYGTHERDADNAAAELASLTAERDALRAEIVQARAALRGDDTP
jgi:hypothetical protein